jgi:hypothetical protein
MNFKATKWKAGALAAVGAVTLAGAAPALAGTGPANAPTAGTGTFSCNSGAIHGTYVFNAGKSQVQTWNAVHLTFTSGLSGTGVFIWSASALSGTTVTKGSHSTGPVECSVASSDGTVTGTVWGRIVVNG